MGALNDPKVYASFELFGINFPIDEIIVSTWIIMAVIIILAALAARNLKFMPKGIQVVTELIVEAIYNLTKSTMGERNLGFAPYIGTVAIYLAFANLSGLFALKPPTSHLNGTFGLALMTFGLIHYHGMKSKGLVRYLKGYGQPFALMTPLNIIGEMAVPISLGFRLFGNVVGGVIIMGLLYSAMGLGVLTGIPAVLHVYFDIFSGLIQTFIFIMLSMVFISNAIE